MPVHVGIGWVCVTASVCTTNRRCLRLLALSGWAIGAAQLRGYRGGTRSQTGSVPQRYNILEEEVLDPRLHLCCCFSSATLAQDKQMDPSALQDCPPIGQSARGNEIYGMDCEALEKRGIRMEVLSTMPPTILQTQLFRNQAETNPMKHRQGQNPQVSATIASRVEQDSVR